MMKILYIFILLFATSCSKGQYLGRKLLVNSLIIIAGESNARGLAMDYELTPYDAGERNSLKILRVTNLSFENLNIGVNNFEEGDSLMHGIEEGLASEADTGRFGRTPIYILKAGFGGSRIAWWNDSVQIHSGINCWEELKRRTDTAIKLLTVINSGIRPPIYLLWFHGINDAAGGTAFWKDSTKSFFAKVRLRYGHVPIFMPYMPQDTEISTNPTLAERIDFNSKITEMASEVTEFYLIETIDAELKNESHWNTTGFKLIASRFVTVLKEHYLYQ